MSLFVKAAAVCDKCKKMKTFQADVQTMRHAAELNWDTQGTAPLGADDLYHELPLPEGWESRNTYGANVEVLCKECSA